MVDSLDLSDMEKRVKDNFYSILEEYIRDNLSIDIEKSMDYGSNGVRVRLLLNNKEISSSYVATEHDRDY